MKVQYALTNLTGGEISPRLDGRPDVAKQRNGMRKCENFQVLPHGGVRKRSGTQFICALEDSTHILQSFQYSTEDSYMLIFGPSYIWIARDRGMVTETADNITAITKANPGVVTAAGHGFSNGDKVLLSSIGGMTELNNRIVTVANKTTDTFEISGVNTSSYGTYTSGGTASKLIIVTTTYTANELQELRFAQYNDVLYITHQSHPLRKLSRTSNTSWALETVSLTTGPFRSINGDDEKVIEVVAEAFNVTGATQANPCVITCSGGHSIEVGDTVSFASVGGMTELNGNSYDVTAVTATTITISVNSTGFTTYTSGGTVACALTTWGTLEKNAKVILTADWGPFDADHVGSLWRLSESGGGTGVSGPPLGETENGTLVAGLVYTSGGNVYGIGTVYGSRTDWKFINRVPDHDAGVVRVISSKGSATSSFDSYFLHPGYCIVQITGVNSSTEATAKIVRYQMPDSILKVGTSFWEEGAWSDYRGYPRCCAFFEQRLFCAGSTSDPTVVWGSRSSEFENFEDGPDDDDAIVYRASSGMADVIRWMSGGRVLVAGTSQGEYAIAASNQNEALTPDNLRMLMQTTYGASDCPPVRVNDAVLYPQRDGAPDNPARKLREFTYDFSADQFKSVDLTVFAEHVTGSGFTRMAYAMQPDPVVYAVRADGELACCTYDILQEVVAWWRVTLGGTDAVAKSVAVAAGSNGDDVWLIVERTIDGGTVRYLEVMNKPFEQHIDVKADAKFVDSSLTYSGSSTSTITGLWHLRGEDVKVLNNGNVESQTVGADGTLTLDVATTKAHIGCGYTAEMETQDLDAGAQAGASQSRMKRVSQVYIRLLGTLGGKLGKKDGTLEDILYRDVDDVMGSSPDLFSGLKEVDVEVGHDREAIIEIQHSDPLPCYVSAVVAELQTQG
jgi:hypothetical protein